MPNAFASLKCSKKCQGNEQKPTACFNNVESNQSHTALSVGALYFSVDLSIECSFSNLELKEQGVK